MPSVGDSVTLDLVVSDQDGDTLSRVDLTGGDVVVRWQLVDGSILDEDTTATITRATRGEAECAVPAEALGTAGVVRYQVRVTTSDGASWWGPTESLSVGDHL